MDGVLSKPVFLLVFFVSLFTDVCGQVPSHVEKQITPYLLPDNHPIKSKLDEIFSKRRVILSLHTLKKAGFINPQPRKFTHLIVTKHPNLPGYIIKTYLDVQREFKNTPDYAHWILRIRGAETIRSYVKKHHLENIFKIPKKWIYLLPEEPAPPKEFLKKYTILVEEDMQLVNSSINRAWWASSRVTFSLLDDLYQLLKEVGLRDCAKPDNIPFAKDGKIAFIDTETFAEAKVLFGKLTPFLSKPMQKYWKKRIKK